MDGGKAQMKMQFSNSTQEMNQDWNDGNDQCYPYNKQQRHMNIDSMNSINKYIGNSGARNELMQPQKYPSYRKKHMQSIIDPHNGSYMQQTVRGALVEPNVSDCNNLSVAQMQINGANRHSWLSGSGVGGSGYNPKPKHANHLNMKNLNPINIDAVDDETQHYDYDDEPVYEEILSKNADNCDRVEYDDGKKNSFKIGPNSSDPLVQATDNDNFLNRNYRNPNQFPTQKSHHSR